MVFNNQQKPNNAIKIRDDSCPIYFERQEDKLILDQKTEIPYWLNGKQEFNSQELRAGIEPWLTALFQSEHLSLLAGAGLTHAIHQIAVNETATGMNKLVFKEYMQEIDEAAKVSSEKANRKEGNLEDQLRIANELLLGLKILKNRAAKELERELKEGLQQFAESILRSERNIAISEKEKQEKAFNTLVSFLMSFASRTGIRDRLNIFTTNYDRLIELGTEVAGLHLIDRFVGHLSPIFRSSRLDIDLHYNPPGIRGEPRYLEGVVKFSKLHGSIDWLQCGNDIRRLGIPFGAKSIQPFLDVSGYLDTSAYQMMIYPNAAKDQETANYPYIELFRDFAAAICRPNSTVVTYGYSFGDDHINRIIRDMLTIPSTHLVIISYNDPLGRIMKMYEELGRQSQISLLIGPELASITNLTQYFLPKPTIDKVTLRMTDLLRQRLPEINKY